MTHTAVGCFKVKDVESRNGVSRPEMMSISQKYQNLCLKRGAWDPDEDQILRAYIMRYGTRNWNEMPKATGLLRSGKSCRFRWMNYLRPDIKRGNFSKEEVQTIIKLHEMLGNRWSAIAEKLPGRTDNDIKNFWNTHLRKSFNNNISNTAVQAPKLEGTQTTSEEESKQRKSSNIIDVSFPTAPKILNSEDQYSSKGTLHMSPIRSTDNFSSSSSSHVNDINENKRVEDNVGSLESIGELSLLDQPSSMEAQMGKVEDYGEAYTDQMWVQELLDYPNASHNFDAGQEFWMNCLMQTQLHGDKV